jgi:uncharacterized protein (DUF427 family)
MVTIVETKDLMEEKMTVATNGSVEAQQAAQTYIPDYRRDILPSQRHVRVQFRGQFIGDSKQTKLGRKSGHWLREYYFPLKDVKREFLVPSDYTKPSPTFGQATYWHVKIGDSVAENAARSYAEPPAEYQAIKDHIAFDWDSMDAWFEEDEEVHVHARDPYHRVDVLNSSRHIQIIIDGETVADSKRPRLLFETGLPTRYYIPKEDVRLELLVPSEKHTQCPYKGVASYYSVKIGDEVHENIAWYYPFPIPEIPKVENLICFYNERVDIVLDGELQQRPKTHFA